MENTVVTHCNIITVNICRAQTLKGRFSDRSDCKRKTHLRVINMSVWETNALSSKNIKSREAGSSRQPESDHLSYSGATFVSFYACMTRVDELLLLLLLQVEL